MLVHLFVRGIRDWSIRPFPKRDVEWDHAVPRLRSDIFKPISKIGIQENGRVVHFLFCFHTLKLLEDLVSAAPQLKISDHRGVDADLQEIRSEASNRQDQAYYISVKGVCKVSLSSNPGCIWSEVCGGRVA